MMRKVLFFCFFFLFHPRTEGNKTFVATNEWKTVEDGETIPAGLHVRINLQTGKKEAKLMEDADKELKSSLIKVENEENKKLDPDVVKELLKNIKADDESRVNNEKKSFRSYKNIKEEFEKLNMNVKTDAEILNSLLKEFYSLTNRSTEGDPGQLVSVLADLEYLVHQYDNAVEFARIGGFNAVVLPCLNMSEANVRMEALRLLGSAVQSNPRVQRAAVDAGCVTILLKLLALERDSSVRLRGIFALSCLLRSFPTAQMKFVLEGGVSVLSTLFDDPRDSNEKTRLKIINLLSDLLVEVKDIADGANLNIKEHHEVIGLELNLREQGWCDRAAAWFRGLDAWTSSLEDVDHSMIDASADLLLQLADPCIADFVINIELLNAVNHAKELYADLVLVELEEGVVDSLFSEIHQKLRSLAVTFARTDKFKDEL